MREIKTLPPTRAAVAVPGSKSYTHRVLIAAALSDGRCVIENALESEDTHLTRDALKKWGVAMAPEGEALVVAGCKGEFKTCRSPIFLGNSGTSMRLLTAVAALVPGTSILTGSDRLRARPIQDLLDGFVFVVRSRHSPRETIQQAVGLIKPGLVAGLVLNGQHDILPSYREYAYRRYGQA